MTVNSSHFHPAHQHYTDEAHKHSIGTSKLTRVGTFEVFVLAHVMPRMFGRHVLSKERGVELYYSNMVFTLKWQYLSVFLRRSTSDG